MGTVNLPNVHGSTFGRQANLSVSKIPLTVLMWNVRGLNAPKKQQHLDWLISEQKPDINPKTPKPPCLCVWCH